MNHPSDTPPDGDFAAYVERLTRAPTGVGPREDMIGNRADSPLGTPFAVDSAAASIQSPSRPWSARAILTHVTWLAVAWIATQLLAKVVPGAGFLFLPAVVAYAVWVFLRNFRHQLHSQGDVATRLRELASQALAEAKDARRATRK